MLERRESFAGPGVGRFFPVIVLALLVAVAYLSGIASYLSLSAISEHRSWLKQFTGDYLLVALLVYIALYITVVALSLPGAAVLSIIGGFLFGWWVSAPVTVVAATIGAIIVYNAIRLSCGTAVYDRAGPMARQLAEGFTRDSFKYLLFLRLVPAFPFFLVNAVAGACRVRQRTFIAATVLGIVPASVAFAYLGSGLDGIVEQHTRMYQECLAAAKHAECRLNLDVMALLTPRTLVTFVVLGLIGFLPIACKYLQYRRRAP